MSRRRDRHRTENSTVNKETKKMIRRLGPLAALIACLAALLPAAPASAAVGPKLRVDSISETTIAPGEILDYKIQVTNVGDEELDGSPVKVAVELPPGLTVADPAGPAGIPGNPHDIIVSGYQVNYQMLDFYAGLFPCTEADDTTPLAGGESEVHCVNPHPVLGAVPKGAGWQVVHLPVQASPGLAEGQILTTEVTATGGGSPPASTVDPVRVSSTETAFGIDGFDAQAIGPAGEGFAQAGGHPDTYRTQLDLNTGLDPRPYYGASFPVAAVKDVVAELPPGFIGDPQIAERCSRDQIANVGAAFVAEPLCPVGSQVGAVRLKIPSLPTEGGPYPLFNMDPPSGAAGRFAFVVLGTVVSLDAHLRSGGAHPDYGLTLIAHDTPVALAVAGVEIEVWGTPGDHAHDFERGCRGELAPGDGGPTCPGSGSEAPFFRMPTSCGPPPATSVHTDSWQQPAVLDAEGLPDLSDPTWQSATVHPHAAPGFPYAPAQWGEALGQSGCAEVPVKGKLSARPTALEAETSSGLDIHVEVPNSGLGNREGIASSDLEDVKIALPQGLTINPSEAEGLGVCTEAQYESSELHFQPTDRGCPSDSKIGTVETKSPLLEETVPGNVYVAKPYENPFDSLLALYIVLEEPQRGILVKQPVKLTLNEESGKIEAEVADIPQVPFDSFDFHFREGARAPLVTPSTCGTYTTETKIEGWSAPGQPIESDSSFQITKGIGGGSCPPGGTPEFKPGFSAGSINNAAGAHTAFDMRVTRHDGEQDMTRFSAVLPRGVLGKLAGVEKCPDSAIARAQGRTGPHGGQEEIDDPSCPAGSQIGRSTVGAGVGSVLTYVPGKVYLVGPSMATP